MKVDNFLNLSIKWCCVWKGQQGNKRSFLPRNQAAHLGYGTCPVWLLIRQVHLWYSWLHLNQSLWPEIKYICAHFQYFYTFGTLDNKYFISLKIKEIIGGCNYRSVELRARRTSTNLLKEHKYLELYFFMLKDVVNVKLTSVTWSWNAFSLAINSLKVIILSLCFSS